MDTRKLGRRALLGVALAAYIVGGLTRISFNVDILKLLPARLGTVTGLSLFARHFSRPTELLVTVEGEKSEEAARDIANRLRDQPTLAARVVAESPWESRPQELSELLAYLLINQPPGKFAGLTARLSPERVGDTLRETKETLADSFAAREVAMASYDPLGLMRSLDFESFAASSNLNEFASGDGTFRVVYVEAPRAMGDYRVAIAWMKEIRAALAEVAPSHGVRLRYTGEPAFVAEISGQMQRDMMSSGAVTMGIITVVFLAVFRRFRPLSALLRLLGLTFLLTLSTAGWVLGEISIIGVGFTSIMIGLSVDYGYMIYQASLTRAEPAWLRRRVLPFVLWAATTTSAAFFTLNASSMPGLNHLGNLVGIGVLIGAVVMVGLYVPWVSKLRRSSSSFSNDAVPAASALEHWLARLSVRRGGFLFTLVLVVALVLVLVLRGFPPFDTTGRALKMRHSEANDTLEHLYEKLTDERQFTTFIVTGANEAELLTHLRATGATLAQLEKEGIIKHVLSPLLIAPDEAAQKANLAAIADTLTDERLFAAVTAQGFTDDALLLTRAVFRQWQVWKAAAVSPLWPKNETSAWILRRLVSRDEHGLVSMGLFQPTGRADEKIMALQANAHTHVVSWALLAGELRRVIPLEFAIIISCLLAVLLVLLVLAFRSVRDVLLLVASTALVFLALMGAMRLVGLPWNAFNIASVMLLLGTGTDYSIYILLSMKRTGGDLAETQRSTGLVVFLCAISAATGFGALGWVGHLGLASLGQTCALGLALDALISVFLLPLAAQRWGRYPSEAGPG